MNVVRFIVSDFWSKSGKALPEFYLRSLALGVSADETDRNCANGDSSEMVQTASRSGWLIYEFLIEADQVVSLRLDRSLLLLIVKVLITICLLEHFLIIFAILLILLRHHLLILKLLLLLLHVLNLLLVLLLEHHLFLLSERILLHLQVSGLLLVQVLLNLLDAAGLHAGAAARSSGDGTLATVDFGCTEWALPVAAACRARQLPVHIVLHHHHFLAAAVALRRRSGAPLPSCSQIA